MGAVTYPDERVAKFLSLNFVPVQIQSANTAMMKRFAVSWTPTLVVLDADLREHHRAVGFFAPDDLIATLLVAKGKWALGTDQFVEARALFEEDISAYPDKDAAAEALFFLGVAKYKMSHDPKPLRQTYEELKARFPQSTWTKQADHYRLIGK